MGASAQGAIQEEDVAEVKLTANKRVEVGKGASRRSRAGGRVPGVVYGHGMEPLAIEIDRREFITALQTDAGLNVLLDMDVDGTNLLTLTKELQRDPVKGTVLHADFIQIDRTEEVQVEVPLHLVGHAAGADEGGVLQQPRSSLHVRSVVTEVPEHLEADISALNIGEALRVSDIAATIGYTVLEDPDTVIASVAAPVSEAELEAMEAEAAAAAGIEEVEEPVEGEEVAEGEEVPEGEEAPEGEAAEGAEESGESS